MVFILSIEFTQARRLIEMKAMAKRLVNESHLFRIEILGYVLTKEF